MVLDLAGIPLCYRSVNADDRQEIGNGLMLTIQLQSQPPARFGQCSSSIALILQESFLLQLLEHLRGRGGLHIHLRCDPAGRRPPFLPFQGKDDLDVLLYRLLSHCTPNPERVQRIAPPANRAVASIMAVDFAVSLIPSSRISTAKVATQGK